MGFKPRRPKSLRKPPGGHPLDKRQRPETYVRHQLVIPTHYNPAGDAPPEPVDQGLLDEFVADCLLLTDGGTMHGAPSEEAITGPTVVGVWRGTDGTVLREPVMTVTVDGPFWTSGVVEFFLQRIAYRIADELDQEAVYYTKHPMDATFISKGNLSRPEWDLSRRSTVFARPEGEDVSRVWLVTVANELVTKYAPWLLNPADEYFKVLEAGAVPGAPSLDANTDDWQHPFRKGGATKSRRSGRTKP